MATEFLESQISAKSYLEALEPNKNNYAGFNLIVEIKVDYFICAID